MHLVDRSAVCVNPTHWKECDRDTHTTERSA